MASSNGALTERAPQLAIGKSLGPATVGRGLELDWVGELWQHQQEDGEVERWRERLRMRIDGCEQAQVERGGRIVLGEK